MKIPARADARRSVGAARHLGSASRGAAGAMGELGSAQLGDVTILPNSRWSRGSQIGAPALSNYVKCPKARWIGGPNSLDHFQGFCNSPHMLCIVQL